MKGYLCTLLSKEMAASNKNKLIQKNLVTQNKNLNKIMMGIYLIISNIFFPRDQKCLTNVHGRGILRKQVKNQDMRSQKKE